MNHADLPPIHDFSPKEFRDIAKAISQFQIFEKKDVLAVFEKILPEKFSHKEKEVIFEKFFEHHLIEIDPSYNKNTTLTATINLRAISGLALTKRKQQEEAWLDVAKFVARTVVLANAENYMTITPSKLYLFGSMLDSTKENYGDADLALTMGLKQDYESAKEKQQQWLKKYADFTSSSCWGEFGFCDEIQLTTDMKSSNSFYSIHYASELNTLSAINDNLPLMCLWENYLPEKNKRNEEDNALHANLCNQWKASNADQYEKAQEKLNAAFKKLGISRQSDNKFIQSCEKYMENTLKNHLVKTITKGSKDDLPTNRAARFGDVGKKAILKAAKELKNISFSHLGISVVGKIRGVPTELKSVINAASETAHLLTFSKLATTKMHYFLEKNLRKFAAPTPKSKKLKI